MSYTTVNPGDEILAAHISELQGSLTGVTGKGQQILLTDYSHASNYNLVVQNLLGKHVQAKGSNNNDLLLVNDTATTVASLDGTQSLAVANAGVTLGGTTGRLFLPNGASKRLPPLSFTNDTDLGWYRFGANILDMGTPAPGANDTEQYVLVGVGNSSADGVVSITKDGLVSPGPYPSAMSGLVVYQGTASHPVNPAADGAIRSQSIINSASGSSYYGMKSNITVERGTGGFIIGGAFGATAGVNAGTGAGSTNGIIGLSASASSTVGGTNGQVLTGLQVNCDALTAAGDTLHVCEMDAGTDVAAPLGRVILNMSNRAGSQSRRAAVFDAVNYAFQIDAFVALSRKPAGTTAATDNFTQRAPYKYGILLWSGYDPTVETIGAGTWPFDNGSTFIQAPVNPSSGLYFAAGRANDLLTFADLRGVTFAGPQYISDNFAITSAGKVAIGQNTTSVPITINTADSTVMFFTGTTANYFVTTVGGPGGASGLPATPSGYLKIQVGATVLKIPCYPN